MLSSKCNAIETRRPIRSAINRFEATFKTILLSYERKHVGDYRLPPPLLLLRQITLHWSSKHFRRSATVRCVLQLFKLKEKSLGRIVLKKTYHTVDYSNTYSNQKRIFSRPGCCNCFPQKKWSQFLKRRDNHIR